MENFLILNPEIDIQIYYNYLKHIYNILDLYFISDLNKIIFLYMNIHPLETFFKYDIDSIIYKHSKLLQNINYKYFEVVIQNRIPYLNKRNYIYFYKNIKDLYFYKFENNIIRLIGIINIYFSEYYFYFSNLEYPKLILDNDLNNLLTYYD